jgi:hypothetical protein
MEKKVNVKVLLDPFASNTELSLYAILHLSAICAAAAKFIILNVCLIHRRCPFGSWRTLSPSGNDICRRLTKWFLSSSSPPHCEEIFRSVDRCLGASDDRIQPSPGTGTCGGAQICSVCTTVRSRKLKSHDPLEDSANVCDEHDRAVIMDRRWTHGLVWSIQQC